MSNLEAARRAAENAARENRVREQQFNDYRLREAANAAFKQKQNTDKRK